MDFHRNVSSCPGPIASRLRRFDCTNNYNHSSGGYDYTRRHHTRSDDHSPARYDYGGASGTDHQRRAQCA